MRSFLLGIGILLFAGANSAQAYNLEECGQSIWAKAPRQLEFLEKPIPMSLYLEIFAVSHPYGKQSGDLFHVRPRQDNVRKAMALEGSKFRKLDTESNPTTASFYRFFRFEESVDPDLGEYWSAVPSTTLFSYLKEHWNHLYAKDPLRRIHIQFETTGNDPQLKMARLWANGFTIGVGDPHRPYLDDYIPTGKPKPKPSELEAFAVESTTNRIDDEITVFMHDLGQMTNALHIPMGPLAATHPLAQFYIEAHELVRQRNAVIPKLTGNDVVGKQKLLWEGQNRNAQRLGLPPLAFSPPTDMDALRYLRIELYHSVRSIHALTHILSWLIEKPAIEPCSDCMTERGCDAQIEFCLHLAALGRIAPGSKPSNPSPFQSFTWGQAQDSGAPVSLESAYDRITNGDIRRIRELVARLKDPELTKLYEKFDAAGAFREVPRAQLEEWSQLTRARYKAMSIK
jgi:hypothetical protein